MRLRKTDQLRVRIPEKLSYLHLQRIRKQEISAVNAAHSNDGTWNAKKLQKELCYPLAVAAFRDPPFTSWNIPNSETNSSGI